VAVVTSLFEGDETITLTKGEAFRILAALMDSLELIDRTSPSFQAAWERPREGIELLTDRIWPDQ
jgi:hypothetical protein